MSEITAEMRKLLNETAIWVLATSDRDALPNAVPIFFTLVLENGKLLLVDNFMNKTIDNIQQNPMVSVSVWKDKEGYQFKGIAQLETSGTNFKLGKELAKDRNPKGVVTVEILSVYSTAPGPDAGKKII